MSGLAQQTLFVGADSNPHIRPQGRTQHYPGKYWCEISADI